MKLPLSPISLLLVFVCLASANAQKRRSIPRETGKAAVVIDETLSVLRMKPSLFAGPIQRMRRGRRVQIVAAAVGDGVKFYKVIAPPSRSGWVQSDALFGKFRAGDEERLARLVQAAKSFEQIELASIFLEMYPTSGFRPAVLLLFGDLLEEASIKLTRDAATRLSRREMAASGAPEHSYYLNFNMLDRYRRIGVTFLFNSSTRTFHYDGATWREITQKFPAAAERPEAEKRLDLLRQKMERRTVASN
jgi:hypothetical protein